jgi:hypothetical protein
MEVRWIYCTILLRLGHWIPWAQACENSVLIWPWLGPCFPSNYIFLCAEMIPPQFQHFSHHKPINNKTSLFFLTGSDICDNSISRKSLSLNVDSPLLITQYTLNRKVSPDSKEYKILNVWELALNQWWCFHEGNTNMGGHYLPVSLSQGRTWHLTTQASVWAAARSFNTRDLICGQYGTS